MAPPIEDPFFYQLAVPVLLIIGLSKGGFGGGAGLIGVPTLALAVPLVQAAAILLPILCAMDIFALWSYRGISSRENLRVLIPASIVGIAAGAWAFGELDERWIRGGVGLGALVFVAHRVYGAWRRGGAERPPEPPRAGYGWLWGSVAGFTSTVAHAGGPPISIHLLPQRLDRSVFVGTTVILFTAINYAKLVPYAWLGQLNGENLMTSLVLSPLAPVGIQLGRWLHARVDDAPFYRIVYALLAVAGAKLVADAIGLSP